MDAAGLAALWRIASSSKKENSEYNGRHVVGKFGIGKLATYVLAEKLTYICKASDSIIRRVTMDYKTVGGEGDDEDLITKKSLNVYEVSMAEVEEALGNIDFGKEVTDLLLAGVPKPSEALIDNEFGAPKETLTHPNTDTWTLVVLSELKEAGKHLKKGTLKRMLEAALPMGSEMAIKLNGGLLASSKIDSPVISGCDWQIGDLDITEIDFAEEHEEEDEEDEDGNPKPAPLAPIALAATNPTKRTSKRAQGKVATDDAQAAHDKKEKISITRGIDSTGSVPVHYLDIPEVGRVTGRVRLFKDKISTGKSSERGYSNGFYVNVLGRIVNGHDPSFGLDNLSHASWARFRMAVKADGLNDTLTTNREQFKAGRKLNIFRAFLRKVFNFARSKFDDDVNAAMPNGGDVLVQSLGVLSLSPLRNVVSEVLNNRPTALGLFDETGINKDNREEKAKSWHDDTAAHIQNALGQVKYEKIPDNSFAKFRLSDSSIIVNRDHPFVEEHSRSKAEKELVRTMAMVNLLTDVYALDIGIKPLILDDIRSYRDRLMRFHSMKRRKSGTHIASLLLHTQHDSDNSDRLEAVLSDALRYLGFEVKDLAQRGQPEGIASAYVFPQEMRHRPTRENPHPPLYTVSFDAKSSIHGKAKTGNVSLDGIDEHHNNHKTTYALVVAPGFQKGAITRRCTSLKITPMEARGLGKLLELTVEYGAISLTKLEEVFKIYEPDAVTGWIENLEKELKTKRPLTIDIFIQAIENLKGLVPNAVPAGTIAVECVRSLDAPEVTESDVIALANGLAILVPDLIGVERDKIVVNANAQHIANAIDRQLEKLRKDGAASE